MIGWIYNAKKYSLNQNLQIGLLEEENYFLKIDRQKKRLFARLAERRDFDDATSRANRLDCRLWRTTGTQDNTLWMTDTTIFFVHLEKQFKPLKSLFSV